MFEMCIPGTIMVSYKETVMKINNNFPAHLATSPRVFKFILLIFSTIFDFIAELGNAELLALVKSILLDKN